VPASASDGVATVRTETFGQPPFFASAAYNVATDVAPPATQAALSGSAGVEGWYRSEVSVALSASDNGCGSGVKEIVYGLSGASTGGGTVTASEASFVIAAEGKTALTYSATDLAGNAEAAHAITVGVDKTAPIVSYTGNALTYAVDQMVSITCSASDSLSGVLSTTCADVAGPAYSFSVGENTYSSTATDKAGNLGSGTMTFAVQVTFASLEGLTRAFVTNAGVAAALCRQLDAAAAAANRGNDKAKAASVAAYVNLVHAQRGKALTAVHADVLVSLAARL